MAKDGTVPPGVDDPEIMYPVRSGDFVTDAKLGWRDAYDRADARRGPPAEDGGGVGPTVRRELA